MSYWWDGSGGGWNGSSWGGSGSYGFMDYAGYSSSVEQIFDMTIFGPYFPGELQTGLNQYNSMVQTTISVANEAASAQRLLNDSDATNDWMAAAIISANPHLGLQVGGVTYYGTDAMAYIMGGAVSPTPPPPGTFDNVIQNAFQAHVTVYADGTMSQMSIQYLGALSGLNGVSGQTINASWNPDPYASLPPSGVQDKGQWFGKAAADAGIDPFRWNPSAGYDANRATVQKVYDWYAKIALQHPELQWAAMARLAGGVVVGALQTLYALQHEIGLLQIAAWILDPSAYDAMQRACAALEKMLLGMQQKIFVDLGWQHAAYINGGIDALCEAYNRGEMDLTTLQAWYKIASGDPAQIFEGNRDLLFREQNIILRDDYALLHSTPMMSTLLSRMTDSPLPGGTSFASHLPNGDITNFDDRWSWLNADLLNRWQSMPPEHRQALVGQPLEQLINRNFAPNPNQPPPVPQPPPTPTPTPSTSPDDYFDDYLRYRNYYNY
jgi:hypothetical protein